MLIFFFAEAYLPVALRQMTDLNHAPFLKMSWRAQTSLILLLPIALVEAHANGGSGWSKYLSSSSSALTLLGGLFGVGFSWASSFSLLTMSLSRTSLAHSTLCAVGMPPVFLTLWAVVVQRKRPVLLEVVGVVLAVVGIAIAVQDVGERGSASGFAVAPTVAGDLIALGSAAMAASFGLCISHVRAFAPSVPIFNFQCAWSACAVPIALLLPILMGETDILNDGPSAGTPSPGLFDWLLRGAYWPQMLFLAIGMGIVCQAAIAYVVQEAGPLPYGLVMCACPAGSSVMGSLLGQAGIPGLSTVVGGGIVLVGLATVLVGNDAREREAALLTEGSVFNGLAASPSGGVASAILRSQEPPHEQHVVVGTDEEAHRTTDYRKYSR